MRRFSSLLVIPLLLCSSAVAIAAECVHWVSLHRLDGAARCCRGCWCSRRNCRGMVGRLRRAGEGLHQPERRFSRSAFSCCCERAIDGVARSVADAQLPAALLALRSFLPISFSSRPARTTLDRVSPCCWSCSACGISQPAWRRFSARAGRALAAGMGDIALSALRASTTCCEGTAGFSSAQRRRYVVGRARSRSGRSRSRFVREAPMFGHGTGSIAAHVHARGGRRRCRRAARARPIRTTRFSRSAIQLGLVGVALLIAMWIAHWRCFCARGLARGSGSIVVVQNIVGSLFNSHLFDFTRAGSTSSASALLAAWCCVERASDARGREPMSRDRASRTIRAFWWWRCAASATCC